MLSATSHVTFDVAIINTLERAQIEALEKTGEYLHTEVVQAQVVPFDKGTLQGDAFFVDYSNSSNGSVTLTHTTPYARRLYYHPEYNFQTTNNPRARGKWFDDWLAGGSHTEDVIDAYIQFYKKITGV